MATNFNSFLQEIECPICNEFMQTEIVQCFRGHSMCYACRKKCTKCPTCNGKIGATRNYTLENLIAALKFPCKNKPDGCVYESSVLYIQNHEDNECEFGEYDCPLKDLRKCDWRGKLSSMKIHLKLDHNDVTETYFINDKSYIEFGVSSDKLLKLSKRELDNGIIEWSMQYIGAANFAQSYIFRMEFIDQSKSGFETILSGQCIPYCSDEDAFKRDKIVIHIDSLKNYENLMGLYIYKITLKSKKQNV